MLWFLTWAVLILLAAAIIGRLAWSVFRKGMALLTELGDAGERLSAIQEQVEKLGDQGQQDLAVFDDPKRLRRERARRDKENRRRRLRTARRRTPAS